MIALDCDSFAYDGGVPVLAHAHLRVEAGEYVVIAGASSSGKTTLARLLAGQLAADAGGIFRGTLALGDEAVRFDGSPDDPRLDPVTWSARVGFVAHSAWGQLSMMSATVAEEIAFGPANRGVPELEELVAGIAATLGLTELLQRDPRRLSGGQLQRTIIGAAMAQRPEVLVLDEPFQGLDEHSAQGVADALESLRAGGTAVVVCEPMLPRAAPPDARVVALADGTTVFAGPLAEARRAGLRVHGIGSAGDAPRVTVREPEGTTTPGRELVAFRGVGFTHGPRAGRRRPARERSARQGDDGGSGGVVLVDVNLSIGEGEIVAVRGANGSGKSTLLQHLNGLSRATTGVVVLDGTPLAEQPTGSLAGQVGYLFQDTDQQLFERTVLREVSYGPLTARRPRSRAEATSRASDALSRVGLGAFEDAHPYELGFVQRRFVALASIIATGPVLWALDEPTSGLDDPGRTLLAALITEHARAGGAVVMATHDDAFAEAVAHRSIRLDGGRALPATSWN